ncbi:MAG: hypothetical protein K2J55_03230, partial [Eubacterium sp.]|nr:hypothetical protein [Eubacterium sp.]
YVNDNGVNKLYGYELYVIGIEDRFVTKYQMNNGENDSALRDVNYQIIKKDTKLTEMLDGQMVLAQSAKEQENPNEPYIVEGYDVVKGVNLVQYNAGLVPVREYHISGYVWNDINRDGFINEDEQFMSDINVTLERYYFLDGKWYELPEEEKSDSEEDSEIAVQNEDAEVAEDTTETEETSNVCATDKDGFYSFNNLPLYTVVDGRIVVCGYKVKIENLPTNYAVTVLHANEFTIVEDTVEAEDTAEVLEAVEDAENAEITEDTEETTVTLYDSDLNDKTGYLEDSDALIVLADLADETTPETYVVDNFNISYGESVEHLDAGLVPFGVGSIAGILFEDANENGKYDNGELIFEGETINLDYFLADKQDSTEDENGVSVHASEGKFVSFKNMKAVTDENGYFIFENLPILDEDGNPYQYRLDMKKPSERHFTKSYGFVIMGKEKLNILSQETPDNENAGITPVISIAVPRNDKNYYNLKWEIDGYNHTNAYLGLSMVDNAQRTNTGLEGTYLWTLIPVTSAALLLFVVVYSRKKKRKETD